MSKSAYAQKAFRSRLAALSLIGAAILSLSIDVATAQTSLDVLAGTWRGRGTMFFEDGGSEEITCNGYYRAHPNTSVVFRCKGPVSKFELRSKLTDSKGEKVSGTWEERTYGVTGEASGTASANKLNVRFGGSLEGRLDMTFSSSSQSVSVSIDTKGTGLKGARLTFNRI